MKLIKEVKQYTIDEISIKVDNSEKSFPDLLHDYNKEPLVIIYYIYESKINNPNNKL